METIYKKIRFLIPVFFVTTFLAGCTNDDQSKSQNGDSNAIISLSVKAASSGINEDNVFWEDRVDEIRMIVFDSGNGNMVFNQKLYFPDGFSGKSKGVSVKTGTYNLYFIANETVYTGDFLAALTSISNESEFATDDRFRNLLYNPDFIPDQNSENGRFLMSAIYNNVDVTSGGTETSPAPLIIPTGSVELIRALAKVDVIFRKKVAGSNVPANTVTSVRLDNVASDLSVPPVDDYYSRQQTTSRHISLAGLDYSRDSIGSVTFYVPEFLAQKGSADFTSLNINNKSYPIETDGSKIGITLQRRTVPVLSDSSVVRNYHYIVNAYINAQGGLQIKANIEPWDKNEYKYIFQGGNTIIVPPVFPTDSGVIIIPMTCGEDYKLEILSTDEYLPQGLQGAYGDIVNYWDPEVQGPSITKGQPPYYCEKKYGPGWRLINSCELMSFLTLFDQAYRIWQSNTWEGVDNGLPFYPLPFRQASQTLLQELTGVDLSHYVLSDNDKDVIGDDKLNVIDRFFTPGDIILAEADFPNGWPYDAPPNNSGLPWYPSEVIIQVKAYWYPGYLDISVPGNADKILYEEFSRYDYSSTVSRCVRVVK